MKEALANFERLAQIVEELREKCLQIEKDVEAISCAAQ